MCLYRVSEDFFSLIRWYLDNHQITIILVYKTKLRIQKYTMPTAGIFSTRNVWRCYSSSCNGYWRSRVPDSCQSLFQNLRWQQINSNGLEEDGINIIKYGSTARAHIGRKFISWIQFSAVSRKKITGDQEIEWISGNLATVSWALLSGTVLTFITNLALMFCFRDCLPDCCLKLNKLFYQWYMFQVFLDS